MLTVVFRESPSPAVVGGDMVTIAVVTVVVQFILGYESMDRSSFLMVGLELGSWMCTSFRSESSGEVGVAS